MLITVLTNLSNELGKRDKMRGLSSIRSLFCNEFNIFSNTEARMLYLIYYMTLKLLFNRISFCVKALQYCYIYKMYAALLRTSIHGVTKILHRIRCAKLFEAVVK